MAKYGKHLFYKRVTISVMSQFVGKTLTIQYDISAFVTVALHVLYNILAVDARSLWQKKSPGKAQWQARPPENPSYLEVIPEAEPPVAGGDYSLLLETGGGLLLETGGDWLLE